MLRIEVKNRPLRVTSVEMLKTCISEGFGGVCLLNFRQRVWSPCLNFIKFKVMERQFYTPAVIGGRHTIFTFYVNKVSDSTPRLCSYNRAFRCFARVNFAFCQTHLDFENISHTDMMLFCRHLNSGNKFAQNWHIFADDKGMWMCYNHIVE